MDLPETVPVSALFEAMLILGIDPHTTQQVVIEAGGITVVTIDGKSNNGKHFHRIGITYKESK